MPRLTLAQQIAQLEDTTPADFDPEDAYREETKDLGGGLDGDVDMDDRDPVAGREHYVEVGSSQLRNIQNITVDPKYDGVKMSRSRPLAESEEEDLAESDGEDLAESDEEDQDQEELDSIRDDDTSSRHYNDHLSTESQGDNDLDYQTNSIQNGKKPTPITSSRLQECANKSQVEKSFASSLLDTRTADKIKGKAVVHQLEVWDSLIDARIRQQKTVIAANKLPHPDNLKRYVSGATGRAAAQIFLHEALQLSEELFELRHHLLSQKGFSLPPRKKRKIDPEEECSNFEALVEECSAEMVALDVATHADTLSTLQKWSSKVQAVAPSTLLPSSRSSFKGPTYIKSAAELVDEALRDQDKALQRTWGRNDKIVRIGGINRAEDTVEDDKEAFDDRDFYQSMLRDVIESKGGKEGIDAAELYGNSKKQKKKIVDTKASKGRKLRYEPHEKLQHFMVPVPVRGAWHEEQIDELFSSLLGKGFEDYSHGASTDNTVSATLETLQGFRVIG